MQVAPNQVSPGEPFDVFYFVRNHLDAATYYVRAKIYDVRTGELLDTVALEQSPTNSRLFIKTVQAPPDPVGYGRNIVAIASVYTDSGFTTLSDIYEEQEQYYLIKAVLPVMGGGGVAIDYLKLKEMMEEVAKAHKPVAPEPAQPVPYDALFGAIGALQREVNRVPKEIDLSSVSASLSAIQKAIAGIPDPKEADLSPITEAVNDILFEVAQLPPFIQKIGADITATLERLFEEQTKALAAPIEPDIKHLIDGPVRTPLAPPSREEQSTPSPFDMKDLRHLM